MLTPLTESPAAPQGATPLKASRRTVLIGALLTAAGFTRSEAQAATARHAIAMQGEPAWPSGFSGPTYADTAAPKGGQLTQGVLGTFDSLNPFIVKGLPAANMRSYVIESLLARGYDEPFTLYGLLADSIETDDARSYVTFTIHPAARFADGRKVTADDVVFSFGLLRDRGRPLFGIYYSKVTKAEAIDTRTVRFDLTGADDRELPLILGLMPVLAKHAVDAAKFEDTTFEPLLGSGPYRVTAVRPGETVTLTRNPDYWGRDLAINRGLWNFDTIKFDYYRDGNTHFEAFKKGLYDVRVETDPGRWKTAYDFPALRDGHVVKEELPYGLPKGMQGLVFNTRRPIFADIRVREAILELFDFEWINHNYFFDLYARTASYFDGCELSAHGEPANARERDLLAPFPGVVRDDIMQGKWAPPVTDGSGRDRVTLRRAFDLLAQAGYGLNGTQLVHRATGKPFHFEILCTTRDQERAALVFARSLKRAGIDAMVRSIDATQFERRRIAFEFDMMDYRWEQSLSPGNEQLFYWGSAAADQPGSRNYMGVKSAAVDAMIAAMLKATARADFVAATRALDRVLLSGFYVVPLYFPPKQWVARWTRIEHPPKTSLFGYLPETWWHKREISNKSNWARPVILQGDKDQKAQPKAQPKAIGGATLDELFRRAGVQSADKVALIDPPNRSSFTDGPPRRLTFAQADRAISALAAKLCRLGLQTDTVVAIQLPNTVESIITLLAVLRAGMIAVPLPLLWRQHDLKAALSNVGAKVIITTAHVGAAGHADIAMQVAADLFPIRFVCAYGSDLADGVVPLDDIFAAEQSSIVPRSNRVGNAADHVAVVTFDVTPDGLVAVARSHAQLMAGGSAVFLEAGGARNANILSSVPVSSFAGLAASLLPWLLDGGTLSLHHGFAPATFGAQCDAHIGGMIVLPGPAVMAIAGAGFLAGANTTILALWRSPEQLVGAGGWRGECGLVDLSCFGEVGLILTQRGAYGLPSEIPLGIVGTPQSAGAIETMRGKNGTLALRGAMVPAHAFPPGAEYGHDAWLKPDDAGFIDTGYTCRLDPSSQSLIVTGPPGGVTTIGGYRFRPADIEAQVAAIDPAATATTLPGGVMSQQLAGSAIDTAAVRGMLLAHGANPLIAGAFRPRGGLRAA